MSHQPERTQKDCLNCGTEVAGRYCQQCGQENIVTHQKFWQLAQHFVFDIFHFDGKFFDTLRFLITRPGKVARDYVAGKRMTYLDPIRMYLFTSALFFLIVFATRTFHFEEAQLTDGPLSEQQRFQVAAYLSAQPADSFTQGALRIVLDSTQVVYLKKPPQNRHDSQVVVEGKSYLFRYRPDTAFAKINTTLPADSWAGRMVRSKAQRVRDRARRGEATVQEALFGTVIHRMPYILFVSLPFFGLLLKLLYARRNVYFSDHMTFTLYHYIFNFILLLLVLGVVRLYERVHWEMLNWVALVLLLSGLLYLYKGMRNFYGQSHGKTLVKFLLLNLLGLVMLTIIFIAFLAFSAIQL